MDGIRRHRDPLAIVAALVLPLVVVAILVPFRSSFADTASALVLVAVIVAVAAIGSRAAGFLATVSATLWFDFFLTRPYEKFAITHRPDIETAVSLFVVGIVVTELAARNRHHHEVATEEADYVGLIYSISELAVSGAPPTRCLSECGVNSLTCCTCGPAATNRVRLNALSCGWDTMGTSSWQATCGAFIAWASLVPNWRCLSKVEVRPWAVSSSRRRQGFQYHFSDESWRWPLPIRSEALSGLTFDQPEGPDLCREKAITKTR
jgi:hypothetical protein